MNNVLVIGGAGYVGSHQVKMLCDYCYNTIVFDNLSTGFEKAVDKRAELIIGDIRNTTLLIKILTDKKIDCIMHFAALSLVGESMKNPYEYYDNNVFGMHCLLKAMVDGNVKKLIFSSSAAVYGMQDVIPIKEESVCIPNSTYGQTKLNMEQMIHWFENAHDIKYVSLRYFNMAGADESGCIGEAHNPETHLIPLVIKAALKEEVININGTDYNTHDGTNIRDYIHVTDLCDAHVKAMEYLYADEKSEIINLGYGNGYSVLEIIKCVEKILGIKIKKEIMPRRAGDPDILIASNERAKELLKWSPKYDDIDYIIKSALKWHEKNPHGYRE